MNKEPKVVDAFLTELASAQGLDKRFDVFLNGLKDEFVDLSTLEYRSRTVVEKLALGLQASVLLKDGDEHVAEGFVASRIKKPAGLNYGTLPTRVNCQAIIERTKPHITEKSSD
ncbi:MAG: putative acyl-CoA dehydrogenase [Oleispira sp.]|jgi:putative acyl-CoA dehydrogenase